MALLRSRMKKAGWRGTMLWLPGRLYEQITSESKRIGVWQRSMMRTAVEIGMRQMNVSLIEAHDREMRAINGLPMRVLFKRGLVKAIRDPQTRRLIGVERVA